MGLTLYLLRHGQTALSREDTFCGSGLDPELTPEGLEMAQAFMSAYRTMPWAAIFSSSLRRTITTAEPLCQALGMKLEMSADLNEIAYGEWEQLTKKEVEQRYHDDYVSWLADPAWHAPTGGELAVTVACRALRLIEQMTHQFTDGNVLAVSHKATIRIILARLLGIDLGSFRYRLACPVGSVSIVEFNSQGPMLRALANRSHLSEALQSLPGT
jgi:broad specificity phosphatase PhoE